MQPRIGRTRNRHSQPEIRSLRDRGLRPSRARSSASTIMTTSLSGSDGGYSVDSAWATTALASAELSCVEEGLAWFKLIFGLLFLTVGTVLMARLYYVRNVFEIHARSPLLVLLNGMSLMGILGLITAQAATVLDPTVPIKLENLLIGSYFVTFTFYSCLWARALRLSLAFCPRLKRKIPWLMSENLLVFLSLLIGAISVSIPLYKLSTYSGPFAVWEFALDQEGELALIQWILVGVTILWLPIVWRVDDLFKISREMFCVVITQLFQNVAGELATEYAKDKTSDWINRENIPFVSSVLLFGMIVIEPIRRLTFDPMSKTYPALARAQDRRRQRGLRALKKRRWSKLTESDSQLDSQESLPASGSDVALPRKRTWSYETLAAVPGMAAAFRAFAFRALCQESVLFLEEAKKYQHGEFSMIPAGAERCQTLAFRAMVDRFFADGAVDEINISGGDKKQILELSRSDAEKFSKLDDDHRRAVFGKAYVEIRYMLETNLLGRFMETTEFKEEESRTPLARSRRRKRGGSGSDICFDVENPLGTASSDTRSRSPPDVSPPETC